MRVRLAAAGLSFLLSSAAFAACPRGPVEDAHAAGALGRARRLRLRQRRLDVPPRRQRRPADHVRSGRKPAPPSARTARSSPSAPSWTATSTSTSCPAAGGVPKRLTWHPGRDVVQGFTPDGKAVLFASPREAFNNRHTQLYTVPVEGGVETKLPIPHADRAAYSPDGKTIAYTPNAPAHLQWKRYRGGTVSTIWLYDVATHAVEKVPQPARRCNDADPMWVNGPGGATLRCVPTATASSTSTPSRGRPPPRTLQEISLSGSPHAPHRLPRPERVCRRGEDRLRAGRHAPPPRLASRRIDRPRRSP